MKDKKFYSMVDQAFSAEERAILVTVTEIGEKDLDGIPAGGKMLLWEKSQPVFKDPEIEVLYQKLTPECWRSFLELEEPVLKKIDTGKGEVEIFVEPLAGKPRLIIFGGGHVARPLARLGKMMDFQVMVIDDRKDMVSEKFFPEADELICADFNEFLSGLKIRSADYLVIVTRGHKYDYYVLREVIASKASYIGMIGSKRKVKIIFDELRNKDGISEELIESVYSPIGLDIGAETPEEIAIAIAAEIIKVRRG